MTETLSPTTPPTGDRRGMDAAVIALIKQLHEHFVETHSDVHKTFVESHEREHNLRLEATTSALKLAEERLKTEVEHLYKYYDTLLHERDTRSEQRFEASQTAVTAAFDAREKALVEAFDAREKALIAALDSKDKAVQAAFESAEKAIAKAELSIEKRADATYVTLQDLSKSLSELMPRAEAEQRFNVVSKVNDDLKDRVKGLESLKQGGKEAFSNIQLFLGIIIALVAIAGFIIGTR